MIKLVNDLEGSYYYFNKKSPIWRSLTPLGLLNHALDGCRARNRTPLGLEPKSEK